MPKYQTRIIVGIVGGALLMLVSALVAFCGNHVRMDRAYATLAAQGIGDPTTLPGKIRTILYFTAGGCAGFLIGLTVLVFSLISYRRTRRDVK